MEQAVKLEPSRLAVFGYAHVPWFKKHQKILEQYGIPGAPERFAMFEAAEDALTVRLDDGRTLTVPLAWSTLVLLGMIGGATWISKQRGQGLPNVTLISLLSIGVGAGLTIVVMTWAGAIDATVRSLVPVGSMVIANAMKINGLALDRFKQEIRASRNVIEMGLALGGPPQRVLAPHVRDSVRSALIPVVDALKSLGWVWIPGIMAGMILAGDNPIYAALYQFVIMAMIFAAGGLTSMIGSMLMARAVITDAEQLVAPEPEDS